MVSGGLFTQIGMLIISVGIIFTYIKPEFVKIGEVQDLISEYQIQGTKVLSVNSKLSDYVSRIDTRSAEEQRRLKNYIPDTVDSVVVLRDLYLMTKQAGVIYVDAEYQESNTKTSSRASNNEVTDNNSKLPLAHPISLSVEGTYDQIKIMLNLLEHNNYPLQISTLSMSSSESGMMKADIELNTYSYREFEVDDNTL
ncbi:MAG: hypothetical protein RLZZ230_747 [Candidatus Parcubacteria bacterium]|jgi:hypothetical protein